MTPALESEQEVVLDFSGVDLATQSFIHALVSGLLRRDDLNAADLLVYEGANETIQALVEVVYDYSQDQLDDDEVDVVPVENSGDSVANDR